jgi:Flp pilus assembly protein TadG
MSGRAQQALRDEQGQVLVFAVLTAGVLIAVLALVVNVGGWFQAQRRAQSVADAAALAAAPQLLDDPSGVPATVDAVAAQNWSGVQVTKSQTATAITVVAKPPPGGVLEPFGNALTPDINASATASIQAPAKLSAVAPIVVVCSWCSTGSTWNSDPWNDGVPVTFTYDSGGTPGSSGSFAPIQLPGVSTGNFGTYVTCNATDPSSGNCNSASATAPDSWGRLCLRFGTSGCRDAIRVANALSRAADDTVHLVAIAAPCNCGRFNVVGWGAGKFTNVSRGGQTVQLSVSFQKLLVDGKWTEAGASPNQYDFGVRAIALTG